MFSCKCKGYEHCVCVGWTRRLLISFTCMFVPYRHLVWPSSLRVLSWFIQAFCEVRTTGHSISQNAPVALMFRDAGHSHSDQRSQEDVCLFQSCLSICKTFLPHILPSHSLSRSDLEQGLVLIHVFQAILFHFYSDFIFLFYFISPHKSY